METVANVGISKPPNVVHVGIRKPVPSRPVAVRHHGRPGGGLGRAAAQDRPREGADPGEARTEGGDTGQNDTAATDGIVSGLNPKDEPSITGKVWSAMPEDITEPGAESTSPQRDTQWRNIAQVQTPKLVELMFNTIDSDNDRMLDRKEIRYSPFGEYLMKYWSELDTDQDQNVSFEEFTAFFTKLEQQLGSFDYTNFVIELIWNGDIEVTHLLPGSSSQDDPGVSRIHSNSAMGQSDAEFSLAELLEGDGSEAAVEPVSAAAVMWMATYLGVQPTGEFELMSLIRQAVYTQLPDTIEERDDPETGEHVFYNSITKESSTTHPFEDVTKEMVVKLREDLPNVKTRTAENIQKLADGDTAALSLDEEEARMFQRVVGITELLVPKQHGGESEQADGAEAPATWSCWPVRLMRMYKRPWMDFVSTEGEIYYTLLNKDDETADYERTYSTPFDWATLDEVTTQLHWYYRLHPTGKTAKVGVNGAAKANGSIVRGRQSPTKRSASKFPTVNKSTRSVGQKTIASRAGSGAAAQPKATR